MRLIIKTPARLHMGLLDLNGELGRLFGSIGCSIRAPNVVLKAEIAERLSVTGEERERVTDFARRFLKHYPLGSKASGAHLHLDSCIPAHVGLGSGTQLALAVGTALAALGGVKLEATEIAKIMGRGVRSGIGTAVFQKGGFSVDGGHSSTRHRQSVPPVLFHARFPEDWHFVVSIPKLEKGLFAEREREAFRFLSTVPCQTAGKICRLVLMKLLPGLVEKDIDCFGQALTAIQQLVGECFESIQGGRFACTVSAKLISRMLESGARGAGQSSWGPTVYALAQGKKEASALELKAKSYLAAQGGGTVFVARGDNRGTLITTKATSERSAGKDQEKRYAGEERINNR